MTQLTPENANEVVQQLKRLKAANSRLLCTFTETDGKEDQTQLDNLDELQIYQQTTFTRRYLVIALGWLRMLHQITPSHFSLLHKDDAIVHYSIEGSTVTFNL